MPPLPRVCSDRAASERGSVGAPSLAAWLPPRPRAATEAKGTGGTAAEGLPLLPTAPTCLALLHSDAERVLMLPTAWRVLPSKATAGSDNTPWTVTEFQVYPSFNCSGAHIPPKQPLASSGRPANAIDGDEETYWRATCDGTCAARSVYVGFEVLPTDAAAGRCLRIRQCEESYRWWRRSNCAPDLVLQEQVDDIWYDVAQFETAGPREWTQYDFSQRPPSAPWPPGKPPAYPPPPLAPPLPPSPSSPPPPAPPPFVPPFAPPPAPLGAGALAGIAAGGVVLLAALLLVAGVSAARLVSKLAFGAGEKPCGYTTEEEIIWLETRHSRIPALHIARGHPLTLLVSHSNSEDLGDVRDFWTAKSTELAVNVLAYEYSGYGHSTGSRPSERRICADATAAFAYATEKLGLLPERDIVLYGKSVGSVPTLHLAGHHAVRGVILVSALASGARVFSRTFGRCADGLRMLPFNNLARLKRVRHTPVQLIHGVEDELVSIEDARLMYAICKEHHPLEPCWIDGGAHNGIETGFEEHTTVVKTFLQQLLSESQLSPASEKAALARPDAV